MLNANGRPSWKGQLSRYLLAILVSTLSVLGYAFKVAAQSPASSPQANGPSLEQVLNRMDATAASFKAAQADFQWDTYTAVVNDHDVKVGTVYYRKQGNAVEMAAQVRPPDASSVQQYVLYKNDKVEIYNTGTKQVQEYPVGKNKADVQSFLVLGFGGGGHEMLKSFDVSYAGSENVQGVNAAKLELVPKSDRAKGMFNKIVLWIDPARGISVQQQLFAPGGDYKLSKYNNIKLVPKLPDDVFKLKKNG